MMKPSATFQPRSSDQMPATSSSAADDDGDHADRAVLAVQVRGRALLDRRLDLAHALVAGRLLEDPARQVSAIGNGQQAADQGEEHVVLHQERLHDRLCSLSKKRPACRRAAGSQAHRGARRDRNRRARLSDAGCALACDGLRVHGVGHAERARPACRKPSGASSGRRRKNVLSVQPHREHEQEAEQEEADADHDRRARSGRARSSSRRGSGRCRRRSTCRAPRTARCRRRGRHARQQERPRALVQLAAEVDRAGEAGDAVVERDHHAERPRRRRRGRCR